MAQWHYVAFRVNGDGTETPIDTDVPISGVQLIRALSGPPAFSGTISPVVQGLVGTDGAPVFEEYSTAIYAVRDQVVRGAAIITSSQRSGPNYSLTGAGWTAMIAGQPYEGSTFFVQTDPLAIVRHIWDHWQSKPGGNLALQLDRTSLAGVKIGTKLEQVEFDTKDGPVSFEAGPYKLADYLTDDLGGKVDQLAGDYGFEYEEKHAFNAAGTGVTHYLDFSVPRIGSRRFDIAFVVGENVVVQPTENTPDSAYASGVLTRGAGDGPTMKRKFVWRSGERRLRRVHVVEDKQLRTDAAVIARGNSALSLLTGHADIGELTLIDHPNAPLGSWNLGDEVEIRLDTDWRSEAGVGSMWLRILGETLTPDTDGISLSVVRADRLEQ